MWPALRFTSPWRRAHRGILTTAGLIALAGIVSACASSGTSSNPPNGSVAASPDPKPAAVAQASPGPSPAAGASASPAAGAPSPRTAGTPEGLASAQSTDVALGSSERFQEFERGGSRNLVRVDNNKDGRFRARGNADLVRVMGDEVTPANIAEARSSCTDCQSIAVAIQVVLYRRGASVIAPVNRAVSINQDCTRCYTLARAMQYVIPVDNPRDVPRDVNDLVRAIDREMRYFESIRDVTRVDPQEAQARLNSLVSQFGRLQQYLQDLQEVQTAPTAETAGAAPSPSASVAGTPRSAGTPPASTPSAPPRTPAPAPATSPAPAASPTP